MIRNTFRIKVIEMSEVSTEISYIRTLAAFEITISPNVNFQSDSKETGFPDKSPSEEFELA